MKKSQIAEQFFNLLNCVEDYLKYGFKTPKQKIDFSFLDIEESLQKREEKNASITEKKDVITNNNLKSQTKKEMVELAFQIKKCERCALGKECKNKVPGIGEVPARILVISDYLTYEAEKNNIPLNQNELELLYKWFEAINIPKNQLFITSILKCANYNTKVEREHIEQCRYYLDKQIEILNPAFIFTIGDIALSSLKKQRAENKLLHGTQFIYNNCPTFTTYHPKDMLNNNELKKIIWADLKKFKNILENKL